MARRDLLTRSKKKKAQQLVQQNRIADACQLYGQICQLDPLDYSAWINFGAYAGQLGRLDDAEHAFKRALRLKPDEAAVSFNLARLCELKQDPAAAEQHYLHYLQLKPQAPDGMKALARLYLHMGRLEEAGRLSSQALQTEAQDPALLNLYANILQEQGQFDAAETNYRAALAHGANRAEIYANLGNLFHARDEFEKALDYYQQSLVLAPHVSATLGSLAHLYFRYGHFEQARSYFDQALQSDPDNHAARWNRALLLLLLGEFKQGWQDYESRFYALETVAHIGRRHSDKPRWDGSDIGNRTLLVYAEQGLGDTLQFCRYLALIKKCVGRIVFECQPPMRRLLQSLAGVDQLVSADDAVEYDYQIPLLSLPRFCGTELNTIPAAVPYLQVDSELESKWRDLIGEAGMKVGLVWAGNPSALSDKRRSLALPMLAPLAQVPGVCFYSLQKGPAAEQLNQAPAGMKIIDLAAQLDDFADTAAAIANLDLVISVDTAVAHLAGALGRPVWMLIYFPSDWRWLLGREDTPWYPTMRLFRQSEVGEWTPVIERLASALAAASSDG